MWCTTRHPALRSDADDGHDLTAQRRGTTNLDAIVVSAGFAGVCMPHKLRNELGLSVRAHDRGRRRRRHQVLEPLPGGVSDTENYVHRCEHPGRPNTVMFFMAGLGAYHAQLDEVAGSDYSGFERQPVGSAGLPAWDGSGRPARGRPARPPVPRDGR